MSAAAKKLIVCGGNGFLGSRICKYAVARGWDVTSISRSGAPNWSSVTSSANPPPWSRQVTWERADLLDPPTYAALLTGASAVVHSMGILLEADYKGVISGRENPIAGLKKAFSGLPPPAAAKAQMTYETMNRDSAVNLAREASTKGVSTFVYISAAGGAPVLPARYIGTKRAAESLIASRFPSVRAIFVRSPMMYDSSRPITMPLAAATGIGAVFNSVTGGRLGGFLGAGAVKPMKVEDVARAVVEGTENEEVKGVLEVEEIEDLATKGWRKGML
ncbi:NAD dependent epimerase/dehydratase [Zalerion maritima]|uniref:NAD dependent epimerase/dehydratase n=1 Tax=Zalerion maritima TaxID=339359 RepID=A0AAD5WLX0_9PEZI|nr:NAD dependent epimerase/dehydratase [Zalerion maritima]